MSLFFERLSYWLFVATIAWAPFPLGSNRPWSWSLLILLITACWLLWCVSTSPKALLELSKGLRGPILLCLLALGWGIIQVLPLLPLSVAQPIWHSAASLTGRAVTPALSFSPHSGLTQSCCDLFPALRQEEQAQALQQPGPRSRGHASPVPELSVPAPPTVLEDRRAISRHLPTGVAGFWGLRRCGDGMWEFG